MFLIVTLNVKCLYIHMYACILMGVSSMSLFIQPHLCESEVYHNCMSDSLQIMKKNIW